MTKLTTFLTGLGRAVVNPRNAEGLAVWAAAVIYSLTLLIIRPRFESQLWLALVASIPFAVVLYGFRVGLNRVWSDHISGMWVYVSYPDGYPDAMVPEDIGQLGQPRFGLAKFAIAPNGRVRLQVDLYRTVQTALDILSRSRVPSPGERVGVLESKAANYDLANDTLFVAYEVDYFHQELKRDGGLQIRSSPASPAAALPGTWRSWVPGQRHSSRFGRMELYRAESAAEAVKALQVIPGRSPDGDGGTSNTPLQTDRPSADR